MGLIVASLLVLSCQPDSGVSSQLNGDGSGPADPEICLLPEDVTLEGVLASTFRDSAPNPTPTERRAVSRWMRSAASATTLCSNNESQKVREWLASNVKANEEPQTMAMVGSGGQGLCSKAADGRRMLAYMIGSTGYILARSAGERSRRFSFSGTSEDILCARLRLMFGEA
jgi:hypothetical protein